MTWQFVFRKFNFYFMWSINCKVVFIDRLLSSHLTCTLSLDGRFFQNNERLVWHIFVTAIQKWKSFELADSKKIYPIRNFAREIAAAIPWKSRGVEQAIEPLFCPRVARFRNTCINSSEKTRTAVFLRGPKLKESQFSRFEHLPRLPERTFGGPLLSEYLKRQKLFEATYWSDWLILTRKVNFASQGTAYNFQHIDGTKRVYRMHTSGKTF